MNKLFNGSGIRGPEFPEPMRESPAKDAGELVGGFIGDLQGVGNQVSSTLNGPFRSVAQIPGPHRLVGNVINLGMGTIRDIANRTLGAS